MFGLALRWTFKSVMVEFLCPLWTATCTFAAGGDSGCAYIAFMMANVAIIYELKI